MNFSKEKTTFFIFLLTIIPLALHSLWQNNEIDNYRMKELARRYSINQYAHCSATEQLKKSIKACLGKGLSEAQLALCLTREKKQEK